MRLVWILWLFAALAGAAQSPVYFPASQVNALDNAGGGARAMAMGSAYVALADDSSALRWNPAGLARVPQTQVGFHHNAWLAGISQDDLALVVRTQSHGAWALSQDYVDEGSFEGRDASGASTGGFAANRVGLSLGWAGGLGSDLNVGLSMHASRQTLADKTYDALAAGLGLLYRPAANVQIGMDYNALGNSSSGDALASGIRFGASVELPAGNLHALLAASTDLEPTGVNRLHLGSELKYRNAAVRAGYLLNFQDDQWGGLNSMTLGGGLRLGAITLDYAYLPFGLLGDSHRISLEYAFLPPNAPPSSAGSSRGPAAKALPPPQASAVSTAKAVAQTGTVKAASADLEPVFSVLSDGGRLGRVLEARGDSTGASQAYHAALALDPGDIPSWRALANLYAKSGRPDHAASCYQGLLRASPGDLEATQWLKEHRQAP
jgi:tetratricopeptide (TPR) repeat protein